MGSGSARTSPLGKAAVVLIVYAASVGCFSEFGVYGDDAPGAGGGSGGMVHNGGGGSNGGAGGSGGDGPCIVDPDNSTCSDCIMNGLETDVDCGGDACAPCGLGKMCSTHADCSSANCDASVCGEPTGIVCTPLDADNPNCADCTLNGAETDVDCGGDACSPCSRGGACSVNGDCSSGSCTNGTCD